MPSASRPAIRLRQDLTLHRSPEDQYGAPTWTLHDPVRNQYFAIDWVAFEVISRLDKNSYETICKSIQQSTTLNLEVDDIENVIDFLHKNELIQRHDSQATDWLIEKNDSRSHGFLQTMIHSYLFFRLPLFRPDAFLQKVLPHLQFFFSRFFLQFTLFALALGLWGVFRQWPLFSATLIDTFSWEGLAGYAGALFTIKLFHELGHAFVAKKFSCRVPSMGIAFLVMMPMAYTDVTESWKLDSHRKRMMISGAGIATEIIIAAWALLAWTLLPSGNFRGIVFFLATTSLTATLLINASPFMRFDGYYMLCDFTGMPNLHARSFAMARWWLRETLFNLKDPPPEQLDRNKRFLMIMFALGVWIYRLIVFSGIALLVYHFFFKALGIIMFGVEVWYFLIRPVIFEFKVWHRRKQEISKDLRHKPAFYIFWVLIVFLVTPYDFTINSQGVFKPENSLNVIASIPARLDSLPAKIDTSLLPGQPLLAMSSPDLQYKIAQAELKISTLQKQIGAAGFNSENLPQQAILREQLASAREELNGLHAQSERLKPTAPFGGKIIDISPDLRVGDWIPKGFRIATFANTDHWIVDTYIEESDLSRIEIGNWGRFIPETPDLGSIKLTVIGIDHDASRVLADAPLASTSGGHILVRQQNNLLIPERSIYRVRLSARSITKKISTGYLRGSVVIYGWPRSIIGETLRSGFGTLIREAGF